MIILTKSPNDQDSILLMEELSNVLEKIYGNSGKHSFHMDQMSKDTSVFAVAYTKDMQPVGCGAILPYDTKIAEVKRVYAKEKGVGSHILQYLEEEAKKMKYTSLYVETRKINQGAVAFYLKHGYQTMKNYGPYKGRADAICFQKNIDSYQS